FPTGLRPQRQCVQTPRDEALGGQRSTVQPYPLFLLGTEPRFDAGPKPRRVGIGAETDLGEHGFGLIACRSERVCLAANPVALVRSKREAALAPAGPVLDRSRLRAA